MSAVADGGTAVSGNLSSCGWVAGLTTTNCPVVLIEEVSGACDGVDTAQEINLTWDAGLARWQSGATDWTGTGSGGSGRIALGLTSGVPYLLVDGETTLYLGCENGKLLFSGSGAVLCGGTQTACGNFVLFSVSCDCCNPAYAGPGWYCVNLGTGCLPTELLDEDKCAPGIPICSGPYNTEEEAMEVCSPVLLSAAPGVACNSGRTVSGHVNYRIEFTAPNQRGDVTGYIPPYPNRPVYVHWRTNIPGLTVTGPCGICSVVGPVGPILQPYETCTYFNCNDINEYHIDWSNGSLGNGYVDFYIEP